MAVASLVALFLGAVIPPAGAATTADAEADLVVDAVVPAELVPGGQVDLSGHVTAGARALTDVQVTIHRTVRRSSTVSAVEDWLADPQPPGTAEPGAGRPSSVATTVLATLEIGDLPEDGTGRFALRVEADELGLPETLQAAGPYGLQLEATAQEVLLDSERGFLLWSPVTDAAPTQLFSVASFIGPASDLATGLPSGVELEDLTAEGGRLQLLLALARGLDSAWALDPALLAGLNREATRTPTTTSSSRRWLEELGLARGDRDVVLLDWALPSAARLASAPDVDEAHELLRQVREDLLSDAELERLLDGPSRDDVLLHTDGSVDRTELGVLLDGRRSVVIEEQAVPLVDAFALSYTDDAVTELAGPDGPVTAVLVGASVSRDAATAAEGDALATTRLLARLATTTLQRPNDPRLVALALPADLRPTPQGSQALSRALESTSWSTGVGLSQALGTAPSDQEREPLPRSGPLPVRPDVARAFAARTALDAVSAAVVGDGQDAPDPADDAPQPVPTQRLLAAALSGLTAPAAPAQVAGAMLRAAEAAVAGVRIVPGSQITLAAEEAAIPFTVVNDLDRPVRLVLEVTSRSPRLRIVQESPTVVLQPGVRTVVDVDVEAVANGRAEVTAALRTVDGQPWGEATTLVVSVTTQAEARVLGLVAAAVTLLFVGGSVRAVRVNRRRRLLEQAAVPTTEPTPPTGGRP